DAGAAAAAVVVDRGRRRQRQVDVDFTEKEHRAGVAVQRQGVLAAPADAAARCQFDFEHRRRIGEHAVAERTHRVGQLVGELLQSRAQYLVIVATARIDRHAGFRGIADPLPLDRLPALGGLLRQVIHARGDDAHRPRHELGRAGTLDAVQRHVVHRAMKTVVQPFEQAGLCAGQVHVGHADLGKSQRARPLPQARHQHGLIQALNSGHSSILETRSLVWADEAACAASAAAIAAKPAVREAFIELHGTLGAGKTTFVRHLLHALGVQGRVKSPTYAVMEPYELPGLNAWHFDFYRFDDPQEWEDAGFRDLFAAPGLKIAEWPENADELLPPADLRIHIEIGPGEQREVRFEAGSELGMEL